MRNITTFCLILMIIVLQSGCIAKPDSNAGNRQAQDDDILTVYLNDFDDIIGPLFEEATGYRIKLVQGSGAEIMSRIEAERGNPHWDVVWADMLSSIHGLGVNGMLLEGYTPDHAADLQDTYQALVPEEKWYYPTSAHAAAVIVYKHDELSEEAAPATWLDFASPTFAKSIGVADPAIAAPAYSFVNWFFHQYGMTDAKEIMRTWFDNGLLVYPKNPNVATALIAGQIKVAALQENNAYQLLNQQEPISIVWPEEGAPASVRVAAISKETEHREAAQAFINFLLDPATQQAIIETSDESYHEPSAVGVQPKADRDPDAALLFADPLWSYQHEAEIRQWFADFSIQ